MPCSWIVNSSLGSDMDDAAVYRLEGSKQEIGGLIFTKKTQSEDGSFKIPSAKKSLLGLDRLAAIRRKEKDDEIRGVDKSMVTSYTDQDEGHEVENVTTGDEKKKGERHYRPAQDETPSHTGGKRLVERLHKNKERGVHYSSAKKKKRGDSKERDRDKHRRSRNRDSHARGELINFMEY
uniref:Uncharacterized protein n=1 Tax=Timema genevievae TaxID=629358 RepID=A0A7R9K9V5_TIMGE|nr:unnamed protein product [Timema genevievae]